MTWPHGRLAPQAKEGVSARRGLSEEDERDIAKPLTTGRGLAYTYLVFYNNVGRAKNQGDGTVLWYPFELTVRIHLYYFEPIKER